MNNFVDIKKNMEISPALGIGDILLTKMIDISNDIGIKKIIMCYENVKANRENPDLLFNFYKKLMPLLFPSTECIIVYNKHMRPEYLRPSIKKMYIHDDIKIPQSQLKYNNYIVFHTKIRMEGCMTEFINSDIKLLENFCQTFKSNHTIIIMGERVVERNCESQMHNIISLYDILMKLNKSNNVIDLTHEKLYSGNDNFDNFIDEVEIINKASYNITFGWGGPFMLCNAFSKNHIGYVSKLKHEYLTQMISINKNIHRNFKKFLDNISLIK